MIYLIEASYLLTAVLFILGLKRMSHPTTAASGVVWAGAGMVLATAVTFVHPAIAGNLWLMVIAIVTGSSVAWWSAQRVAMTDMPQMIAIYNGMGGGAAGAIAGVELLKFHQPLLTVSWLEASGDQVINDSITFGGSPSMVVVFLALAGALIGTISFTGSCVAYAKLQGLMRTVWRFPSQQTINLVLTLVLLAIGGMLVIDPAAGVGWVLSFFVLAAVLGVLVAMPIGGADMPVIISLFNAFTGLAVAFEGFVLQNSALIIAGTVVGAAGTLLTRLMAKAMNRSVSSVLFGAFGGGNTTTEQVAGEQGSMKTLGAMDAAVYMAYADRVIIIPGYGMAVAQAQHKVWEMAELLQKRGVEVKFAIHPVAGRMPGHMNVLLAEAGVPYDLIYDLDEINSDFVNTDVTLIMGANDVVNPTAKTDPSSPIYGMPVLNADQSRQVLVVKRGQGTGFSGIENALFFLDQTHMVYGDGQKVAGELINHLKSL